MLSRAVYFTMSIQPAAVVVGAVPTGKHHGLCFSGNVLGPSVSNSLHRGLPTPGGGELLPRPTMVDVQGPTLPVATAGGGVGFGWL